jgi:predicted outer membrane protein
MLRRIPRLLRRAVIVAVLLAVSASVYQSWSASSPGMGGWVQTESGPLGPADRDLLVKVRLAGLWEGPTGQQAEQQASSPEVKDVGRNISVEHAELDAEVRRVADQLGVLLPSSPTTQQVGWMNEISQQSGSDYDRVFVQRLREAHGTVLPVIAEVRTSTRNDAMRQFAETADEFVSRHCVYLESTGLVDYSALPQPSPGLFGGGTDAQDLVVPIVVFAAALLAAIALLWALRNRGASRRERITLPQQAPLPELTAVAAIPAPRTASDLALDDTGPISIVSDSGSRRWRSDTGPQRTVSDTGSTRAVTDTGPRSRVSDTGPNRIGSDSGSHRLTGRSGPRHSIRR